MKDLDKKALDLDQMEQVIGGSESLEVLLSRYKDELERGELSSAFIHPGILNRPEMSIDLSARLPSGLQSETLAGPLF